MTVKKSVNLELEALKFMAREEKKRIRKLERDARQHEKEDTQLKKWLEYISNNKKCYEEMEDHDMSEEDCTKKKMMILRHLFMDWIQTSPNTTFFSRTA